MHKDHQVSKKFYSSLRNKGSIALILLILLVIVSSKQAFPFSSSEQDSGIAKIPCNQVVHESIEITSDNDFILQGWPGNGSASNPFLIEGLAISSDDECIRIVNTSSYFIVRNCSLSWMTNQYHGTGVYLRDVTHGTIELSTMSGFAVGIVDQYSTNNVYHNNTIDDTWDGILIGSCNNNVVSNNSVRENRGGNGIYLLDSRGCLLLSNFVNDIIFDYSINCTAGYNSGLMNGLTIVGDDITHWLHQIYNNYIDGKMLGYFRDIFSSIIDGALYSQMVLVNASRTVVSGGVFQDLWEGAQVINSVDCTLSGIVSKENLRAGVNIENSYNCTIVNCSMDENWIGVSISSSDRITVEDSQLNNNSEYNIKVHDSKNCHLTRNTMSNSGIGVSINMANNCTVSENDIFGNEEGIVLSSSNHSLITSNIVHENEIGIKLSSTSSHNLIYWNSFIWNTNLNAVDDGTFNIWDDGVSRGNFWSDYTGFGQYTIPGQAESIDRFPNASGLQIPIGLILALAIIVTTAVLVYSQKDRFRGLKSSKM